MIRAPCTEKACTAARYVGDSTSTTSPGSSIAWAMTNRPSWEPEVTWIWEASVGRERQRRRAACSRSSVSQIGRASCRERVGGPGGGRVGAEATGRERETGRKEAGAEKW